MTTRIAFGDVTNQQRNEVLPSKRITRATASISQQGLRQKDARIQGKENVVANIKENPHVKPVRQVKKAGRKLAKPTFAHDEKMEVEEDETVLQQERIPVGVVDIDAADTNNPQLCAEYAPQIYAYLRQLESECTVKEDYLAGCPITGRMRAVLVDWLVEVQQQFRLLQETLFLTISIIDRYLALNGKSVHRSQLQLVGVSSMFLASKVEEIFAPEISDFVYITDDAYTGEEIRHMELKILSTLDFDLARPISLNFLRRFSKAGDVDVLQHSVAKYILELGLLEYNFGSYRPSKLAAAALYLSLIVTEEESSGLWNMNLQYYSKYESSDLHCLVEKMARMISTSESSKLQAVRNKYSSTKFMKVASLPHVKSALSRVNSSRL